MKKIHLLSLLCGFVLVGCVNNDYDLSDIDTTARFNINDLVIPVNIDGVTLKKVMDLSETSKIKVVDGEYAVVEDGTFKSNKIEVASFTTKKPEIAPIVASLDLTQFTQAKAMDAGDSPLAYYNLSDKSTTITIEAHDVDAPVKTIKEASVDATIDLAVKVSGLSDILSVIRFDGVKVQLLKGLEFSRISTAMGDLDLSVYNPVTGILDFSSMSMATPDGTIAIKFYLSKIDAAQCGMNFSNPDLEISAKCYVAEGRISICATDFKGIPTSLPEQINFRCDIDVSPVEVKTFSGKMKYDITGLNIDPVKLTDIPDFLNQPSTDVKLNNPQIYLQFNNPLVEQGYNLTATTGLRLTANRDKAAAKAFDLDDSQELVADEMQNVYVLSPAAPTKYYSGYSGAEHVGFKALSDVLSGDGMPKTISIDALNPQLPEQEVVGFKLGNVFNPVVGSYVLYAPLQLKEGASIVYVDSIDSWNDEDLDALTIESLSLSMLTTSDVTLDMTLKAYPIMIKGGKQYVDKSICGTAHISSLAKGEQVNVVMNGEITHLDGVCFEATLKAADGGNEVLKPDMEIKFDNLKVKVSGYYEKEL